MAIKKSSRKTNVMCIGGAIHIEDILFDFEKEQKLEKEVRKRANIKSKTRWNQLFNNVQWGAGEPFEPESKDHQYNLEKAQQNRGRSHAPSKAPVGSGSVSGRWPSSAPDR